MAEDAKMVDVAAGLIFRGGLLLIAQRKPGSHLAGLWEFPGGKREPDESWEACLERELAEELGATARIGPLYEEIIHSYAEKTVRLRFFVCALVDGNPAAVDCAAIEWIAREQLELYDFPPADERLIERLKREPWPLV
jgi:mutator protein MutT